ncbi:MAG: hypothetical protein ABSA26_00320 [Thermoguttaceae bacterium]|jgi:hypothetical protein
MSQRSGKVDSQQVPRSRPSFASENAASAVRLAGDEKAFVAGLQSRESESIAKGLASLTFLGSQGRTLKKGSQKKFLDFTWEVLVPMLPTIKTRSEFDERHRAWVEALRRKLVTQKGQGASYGQGQKSLNVFLKFYVDWASRPDTDTSSRLRPWLHCPLDKVVMKGLSETFPEVYRSRLRPLHEGSPQQRFSLSQMSEDAYLAWQDWIRKLSPLKPVLVDVSWALERAM